MTESRRSAACANELHARCPHPMHLRLTGGALCRCACHSSCPVSGPDAAGLGAWRDACTCPGSVAQRAEARRRWHSDRPPTMAEVEQRLLDQDAALSRARDALAARPRGLPADEVRQLLVQELRAQGAEPPPDSVLDRAVASIQRAEMMRGAMPAPGAGILSVARSLAFLHRAKRSADQQMRSAMKPAYTQTLRGPHGEQPYVTFDTDYSLPTVQVTADQRALTRLALPGGEVFVSLLPQAGGEPEAVTVFIDEHHVGVLSATPAPLGVSALSGRCGSGVPCVARCPFGGCGRAWQQPACRGGSGARFHGPRGGLSSFWSRGRGGGFSSGRARTR
jgi:hypothetical protein